MLFDNSFEFVNLRFTWARNICSPFLRFRLWLISPHVGHIEIWSWLQNKCSCWPLKVCVSEADDFLQGLDHFKNESRLVLWFKAFEHERLEILLSLHPQFSFASQKMVSPWCRAVNMPRASMPDWWLLLQSPETRSESTSRLFWKG